VDVHRRVQVSGKLHATDQSSLEHRWGADGPTIGTTIFEVLRTDCANANRVIKRVGRFQGDEARMGGFPGNSEINREFRILAGHKRQ
jgi:hypothetical protein